MQLLASQGMLAQPQQQPQQQRTGLRLPDGSTYVGDIVDGKPHGNGTLTYSGSDEHGRLRYDGGFQNGERSGRGHLIWRDGREYIGEWAKNGMNGKGKFIYAFNSENVSDEGDFQNGKLHGQGTRIQRNRNWYKGTFVNDIAEGQGKLVCVADHNVSYEGIFKGGSLIDGNSYYGNGVLQYRYQNGKEVPPENPCCIIL